MPLSPFSYPSMHGSLLAVTLSLALPLAGCDQDAPADPAPSEAAATPSASVSPSPGPDAVSVDSKVPGTEFDATAEIACGFDGQPASERCAVGVKRTWGEDGTSLVEVTRPDGTKRALFFRQTEPLGADSVQADGSAGWDFAFSRKDDTVTIRFGPETYVIVDALLTGG